MSRLSAPRPIPSGVLGCLAFLLIGWSGLLVPSLIRSIREGFGQSDAGIGTFYFLYAVAYVAGSLGGGLATERLGRRIVLTASAALVAAGLLALGAAPTWLIFLAAALPFGLGAGGIDGGINGLFLDLFPASRGRALNVVHLFFSLGALGAPLAVGWLVGGGLEWQAVLVGTAVAALVVAALFALVPMPVGRRNRQARADSGPRTRLSTPLLMLGVAIACYVASEVGVSSWLVRFLEPAPLATATAGLSLFWAGLTIGRLLSARFADRFEPVGFTIAAVGAMSAALLAAIVVPSLEWSIGLFALAGFASGPVYPMIMAIAGHRYPERPAAVSGFLSGVAVAGTVVYPPVMGFLSVSVGLTVAMLGNVLLGAACLVALVLVGWIRPR